MIVSSRRLRNVLAYTALVLIGLMRAGVARAQLTGGCTQTDMQKNLGGNYDAFTSGSTGQLGHAGTCQSFYEAGSDFSVCRVFPVYDCYGSDGQFKTTFPNDVLHSDVNKCQSRVTTPLAMCVTRDRTACSVKDLETQINTGLSYSIMFQIMLGVNGSCFDLPTIQNKFGCDLTRSKTRVIVKCDEDQFASFWDDDDAVIVFWVICGWCSLSVLGTTAAFLAAAKKWYVKFAEEHKPRDFEDAPLLDVQSTARESAPADENDKKTPSCCGSTLWSVLGAFDALQNYRELIDTTERKVPKDPKTGAVREDHDAETNWFDGIRCVALFAVIYCHWMLVNNSGQSTGFSVSVYNFQASYDSFAVYPVFLSVDAFFYMSAFLFMHLRIRAEKRADAALKKSENDNMYLAPRNDDDTDSTPSIFQRMKPYLQSLKATGKVILYRYLRITPAIMLVIFTAAYLTPYLPKGVLCQAIRNAEMFIQCKKDWWLQMLFVTNLKYDWTTCCVWLWYLSADFQFFVIAVLLAPLYKVNKFVYMGVVSSLAFACLVLFGYYEVYDLAKKYYYVTYTRGTPYFMGLLMATLMNEPTIRRKLVPSFAFQVIGNLVAFCSFIGVVNLMWYNGYMAFKNELPGEHGNRALNASIEAIFCIFMSVTTLLWGSGYGGIIFRFFSHAAFRVPSKLTFSAYIIHLVIIYIIFANRSYIIEHLDLLSYHSSFAGCVFWVMMSAVFVNVFLEAPIGKLNTLITRGGKKRS
jgi:hypothetical protein